MKYPARRFEIARCFYALFQPRFSPVLFGRKIQSVPGARKEEIATIGGKSAAKTADKRC